MDKETRPDDWKSCFFGNLSEEKEKRILWLIENMSISYNIHSNNSLLDDRQLFDNFVVLFFAIFVGSFDLFKIMSEAFVGFKQIFALSLEFIFFITGWIHHLN